MKDPNYLYTNIKDIETRLPGFPSYYETVNQILGVVRCVSLALIIILTILLIVKKIKKQPIHKGLIIIGIIGIIAFILSMVIKMPYWS